MAMLNNPSPEGDPLSWLQSGLEYLRQEATRLDLTDVVAAITRAIGVLGTEIKRAEKPVRH